MRPAWAMTVVVLMAMTVTISNEAPGAVVAPLGTFSNLEYHKTSGDLAGFEIKIVPTTRGYQGALLMAEGMPRELVVVDVNVEKSQIRFNVPSTYDVYGGTTFTGSFDAKSIRGRFHFPGGGTQDVLLRRRSHWDPPSCPPASGRGSQRHTPEVKK